MSTPSRDDLYSLRGRTALVTGAAKGIGASIAMTLAHAGAAVVAADVDLEGARATAERIRAADGPAEAIACDVSSAADREAAVAACVARFGGLDVLVNNAGIFPFRPFTELDEATWDRVDGVNLKGAIFLAQRAAREMTRQGKGGAIVNVTSIDALHPSGALVHYDASKGALHMATRSMALELAPAGIRVNSVAPGAIQTPGAEAALGGAATAAVAEGFLRRIALRRMGRPDEIAQVVLFLASDAASYVTGASIVADGGYLLT